MTKGRGLLPGDRRAGESLGERKRGMFGCSGSAPGQVPYQACCVVHVIQSDPTVIGRTPYAGGNFFEGSLAITRFIDDAFKIKQKLMTPGAHGFKIANRLIFRHDVQKRHSCRYRSDLQAGDAAAVPHVRWFLAAG
jgi:hypothetical protein